MAKVNMELGRELLRRHEQGSSYLSLAKEYELNNKTVSDWVKRAQEHRRRDQRQKMDDDLHTRYMLEHHRMMLAAARGVLSAFETSPVTFGEEFHTGPLINSNILNSLQDIQELLASRGINTVSVDKYSTTGADQTLLEVMVERLKAGLYRHVPELKSPTEAWEQSCREFISARKVLLEETTKALVNQHKTHDAVLQVAEQAVAIGIRRELGEQLEIDSKATELLLAWTQVGPRIEVEVRTSLQKIKKSVDDCQRMVADLTLQGGPTGRCDSCPRGS